jgi:hypothetical protein
MFAEMNRINLQLKIPRILAIDYSCQLVLSTVGKWDSLRDCLAKKGIPFLGVVQTEYKKRGWLIGNVEVGNCLGISGNWVV